MDTMTIIDAVTTGVFPAALALCALGVAGTVVAGVRPRTAPISTDAGTGHGAVLPVGGIATTDVLRSCETPLD